LGKLRTLDDMAVAGKRVVLRADLNVPVEDGKVGDRTRIERWCRRCANCSIMARRLSSSPISAGPRARWCAEMSLEPVVPALAEALGRQVRFAFTDWRDGAAAGGASLMPGEVVVWRTPGSILARRATRKTSPASLPASAIVFVNDAFSAAHRAHASTEGIAHHLPSAAGRAMQAELTALKRR
jgi:phosphoglycerate kinase